MALATITRPNRKVQIGLCLLRISSRYFESNLSLLMCGHLAHFEQNKCIRSSNSFEYILDLSWIYVVVLFYCSYSGVTAASFEWTSVSTKTLPKAQRTRGLSSAYQSNKLLRKSWSNSKIQNFNQTSSFPPNFNFKILTKQPFHNLTKPHQQNTDQTSVLKLRLNFNFKLFTKPCAQSLNKI